MKRIILNGCFGRMGKVITEIVAENEECEICAGVDAFLSGNTDFPVYKSISEVKEKADVIIDFSNPSALDSLLDYCACNNRIYRTTDCKNQPYGKSCAHFFHI